MNDNGILLDIDNTLYDYEKTHSIALNAALDSIGQKYSIKKETLNHSYHKARSQINVELAETAASHNRILYFQRMLEDLKTDALKSTLECYSRYWDVFLDNLKMREGVYDFLEFIKDKKVCLISDLTANIQHRKIKKMQLFKYANSLVTSEEAGREKPHPRMFMLALKKLALKSTQVYMIGDNYEKDIVGAMNLKIKSFWLNTENRHKEQNVLVKEVKSFSEIKGYLNE